MRRLLLGFVTSFLLAWQGAAHADITPQLRHQIEEQAKALSLSRSAVLEELRRTGFLDDKKTAQLALRSTPSNALAWAALQAEEVKPGAAIDLLETVAKGMAAHHVDAIRYEPQLAYLFKAEPPGPIRAPPARRFSFNRGTASAENAIAKLPARAQSLLTPLAKYAVAHPGGVQSLLTTTLRLRPADALKLERSSRSVDELLAAAIHQAEPPPAERYREVVASLIKHGGRAIRHEEVLAMFPDAVRSNDAAVTKAAWKDGAPLSPAAMNAQLAEERLVNQIVVDAFPGAGQHAPAGASYSEMGRSTTAATGSGDAMDAMPSGTSGGGGGGGGAPSFNDRVNNLHTSGQPNGRPGPAARSYRAMRAIGGGRGGGGVVAGARVTFDPQLRPKAVQWETMSKDGVHYASPRITLTDGAVVFARPVRQDIALAAQRLVFGDAKAGISPSTENEGSVLVSMLNGAHPMLNKVDVAEFLVHPAIADLAIGRDLVGCDGAAFLFPSVFKLMLDAAPQTRRASGAVPANKWFSQITAGEYSGWYRYVDRQVVLRREGAALTVAATGATAPQVLFELVRPAEMDGDTVVKPELTVVVDGLVQASPQFRSLNDLVATVAVLRWTRAHQVRIAGSLPAVRRLPPVRTVIVDDDKATFGPRSLASYLKDDIKARSVKWNSLVRTHRLTAPPALVEAAIRDRQRVAEVAGMRALGYPPETIEASLAKKSPDYQSLAEVARALDQRGELPSDVIPPWFPAFSEVWMRPRER